MSFTLEHDVEIDAPPELVWQVLTDFPEYAQWNRFVPECRSSLRPGEAIDLHVRLGAKMRWQREWMIACEPGRGFSYAMKPAPLGALSSRRSHALHALGPARTRYESRFLLRGWMMPLVRALMRDALEDGFTQMTQGLKQRAEALWAAQTRSR